MTIITIDGSQPSTYFDDNIILPTQWKHWCKKANLRAHTHQKSGNRSSYDWFYLKGRGRVWRVNMYNMFQCGDTYEEFDRWALCDITETTCPKTEEQFINAVVALENTHKKRTNDECD